MLAGIAPRILDGLTNEKIISYSTAIYEPSSSELLDTYRHLERRETSLFGLFYVTARQPSGYMRAPEVTSLALGIRL